MEIHTLPQDPADLTLATPEDGMHQAETGTTSCSMLEGTTLGATLRQSVAQHSLGETDLRSSHQQPGARLTAPLDDTSKQPTTSGCFSASPRRSATKCGKRSGALSAPRCPIQRKKNTGDASFTARQTHATDTHTKATRADCIAANTTRACYT